MATLSRAFAKPRLSLCCLRTGARGDFGPDDFDWDKLCREVRGMGMFRPVATSSHLLGALHVQVRAL